MKLIYTSQFKKDFKRISKQRKDLTKLEYVVETLLGNKKLKPKFKDHQLSGKWKNHRDCHIEPDWLLIYQLKSDSLIIERTGLHSELFN